MNKHARNLTLIFLLMGAGAAYWATRPDEAQLPLSSTEGVKPQIGDARPQKIPTVKIADVDRWEANEKPTVPAGFTVEVYADKLDHPRNMFTLPNGDILVAETNKPEGKAGGIVGWASDWLMDKAGAGAPSANRITLLRDKDSDGKIDERHVFAEELNSPFGIALANGNIFIANTDAILWWPYKDGQTKVEGKGKVLKALSAEAPNMHWTKNLLASEDGKTLYIAAGSNSNIQENGRDAENGRARIMTYSFEKNKLENYSIGLRNPVGMDFNPWTGDLWAVVNERDMLGSDLVPDYLTRVPEASDFGWPHHYWGGYTDERVQPLEPETRQYEDRPDYALGAHTAPLGLLFTDTLNGFNGFGQGAFVARHGSWNRYPMAGYDVVFIRFNADGAPEGMPIPFVTGFLDKDDNAHGRPTMLTADRTGALLISDDVGNVIWRVTPKGGANPDQ